MDHSDLPLVHQWMESIPFPGPSWHTVITTAPAPEHLLWSSVFIIYTAIIHLLSVILSKAFGSTLAGYSTTPPLPPSRPPIKSTLTAAADDSRTQNKKNAEELYRERLREHRLMVAQNEHRVQECLFPILTKGISFPLAMYCFWDSPWLLDRGQYFQGWPDNMGFDCCIPDIKLFYMIHLGWYGFKTISQTFFERKLKDYWPTMIHHIAAIGLLSVSYNTGMMLVGIVVLLLHDPADVCLAAGKLTRMAKRMFITNVIFAGLIIVWLCTRILLYPYLVIASPFTDFYPVFGYEHQWMHGIVVMLCTLYVLHIYWFYLMMLVLHRALFKGETKDVRSDTDEEDDGGRECKR